MKLKKKSEITTNKKYFVSYYLNSDHTSISIVTFIANPAFGEIGIYDEQETAKVVLFLMEQKVPKFTKMGKIGSYTYKTMEEWNKFVKTTNKKIHALLNGK